MSGPTSQTHTSASHTNATPRWALAPSATHSSTSPSSNDSLDLGGELDVAHDLDADAIGGFRGQIGDCGEGYLDGLELLDEASIFLEGFLVGLVEDEALASVDDDCGTFLDSVCEVVEAYDSGDAQRACDDGGVACEASGVGGKAYDAVAWELGGLAWGEFLGDDDGVVTEVFEACL